MAIKGYWKLNGNSNDYSGNGNNGTDTNIAYSQAKLSQGAVFNGSSSRIDITDNSTLDINGSIGISFVIKVKLAVAYGVVLVKGQESGTNRVNYNVDLGADGLTLRFVYNASNQGFCYWVASSALTLNKWQHVSITHTFTNTSSTKVFIDGKLITGTWTNGTNATVLNDDAIRFGSRLVQNDRNLNATLDNIIIRNSLITVAETKNENAVVKGFF